MKGETIQTIRETAPAAGVAAGTISAGVASFLNVVSPIIACIATLAGITLSLVLAWKAYNDVKNDKILRRAELDDIKFRQENDLPCRRCTDRDPGR